MNCKSSGLLPIRFKNSRVEQRLAQGNPKRLLQRNPRVRDAGWRR
jgi:hypothetical protein